MATTTQAIQTAAASPVAVAEIRKTRAMTARAAAVREAQRVHPAWEDRLLERVAKPREPAVVRVLAVDRVLRATPARLRRVRAEEEAAVVQALVLERVAWLVEKPGAAARQALPQQARAVKPVVLQVQRVNPPVPVASREPVLTLGVVVKRAAGAARVNRAMVGAERAAA